MSRLMMQVFGKLRPVSFDGGGTTAPLLASTSTAWSGVPFELHLTKPFEGERDSGPPPDARSLLITLEGAMEVTVFERGRQVVHCYRPGSLSYYSGDERPLMTRVKGSGKMMVVRLERAWFERLLHHGAPTRSVGHAPLEPDDILRSLATSMCSEVSQGAGTGALFADSISLALLSRALERLPAERMRVRGSFSEGQQRRLQRYIEEQLDQDLRLEELAALCGLRERHFTTLFRRAFGCSPHRYVIDRRLARGSELLSSTGYDIAEIALRLGFASSSHFATEFKRVYGVTPRRYALKRRPRAGT